MTHDILYSIGENQSLSSDDIAWYLSEKKSGFNEKLEESDNNQGQSTTKLKIFLFFFYTVDKRFGVLNDETCLKNRNSIVE